jgi:O-antigen/teichoic acid export membrane protein
MDFIKNLLKYTKDDSLIRDSFILFVATMIMNFGGFAYHFVMGRMLGPADYGILGFILSLFYILLVPFNVIQTSLSKFVATFKAKNDNKNISSLFNKSLKKLFLFGVIGLVIFGVASIFLARVLEIPFTVLILVGFSIPFILLLPVIRGILQGLQLFKGLGSNMIFEAFSKFFIGLLFVVFGFGVFGAVFGIVASYFISFLIGYLLLRNRFVGNKGTFKSREIYTYSWPVFFALFALTLFYSIDVILVKYYFDALTAGYYAAFAILGRIAFFASFSVVFVLFPKVAETHALGKPNLHILKKSLLLITAICVVVVGLYFLYPKLIVSILFGADYVSIAKYVPLFSIVMSLFSYVYVLSFYNLSINRTKFVYALFLLNILEVIALILFHNSLMQVIYALLILISLTFIFMLIYTLKNDTSIRSNSSVQ